MTGELVDLSTLDERSRRQARAVYEAGFPVSLRAPFEALLDRRPDERTLVLPEPATGDVLGLALVRDLSGTPWTFLRYFVVDAERRGAGLGTTLWRALAGDLAERGRAVLAFDVEDPDEPGIGPDELDERRRRVRFYGRQGAALLPVQGYAPPEHGSGGAAPALRLMAARLPGPGRPPAGGELAELVRAVYRGRYEVHDDALIETTLRRSGLHATG